MMFDITLGNVEHFDIGLEIGTVIGGGDYPEYAGPYEATPKVTEQVFPTKKRSLEDDFTVKEITFLRTANPAGGYTVTIGDI